jgi:crotonobetainyl-CoA:carnitine CoA-transferase CaiB-like acyl-CoA transferase
MSARSELAQIWRAAGLDQTALTQIDVRDTPQCLPSSFNVGMAAQTSIAAAALAAESIYHLRSGAHQSVSVDRNAAELECTGYFKVDGTSPNAWEKFSGLYEAADGFIRVHANFEHHRDGVLALLELGPAASVERDDVARALSNWSALDFESAAAERGLVVATVRSFDEWDTHPQAIASRGGAPVNITRIGEAEPALLSPIDPSTRPLSGIQVLDLTRILAGPIGGRTLAAYGADVMLVNSPRLPNISSIIDTSRGKRSVHLELTDSGDAATMQSLVRDAHVFVQGYRPGGLADLGFSPQQLARLHPGIVCVSLSAYGPQGPWSGRRGFDSLVQTVAGFNHAEAEAAGLPTPKSLPVPILDYASGFLMAFGAQAALLRQAAEGGSWHVEVSLLQTANWLRRMGRLNSGLRISPPSIKEFLAEFPCQEGRLEAMPHAALFSDTPALWVRPSARPGSHAPKWDE